jgi:hypothetical protein
MESHEKHWLCPYNCPGAFTSAEQFENHLQTEHLVEAPMLATLSKSCARKSNLAEFRACTLCERPITDSGSWFSHVGHHLEQLALFALPSHLISATPDDDCDVVSDMEEKTTRDVEAEDTSDPLSDREVIEGRQIHNRMDLDGAEDLPGSILLKSGRIVQPEVLEDSTLAAPSHRSSSRQDHDNRLPSLAGYYDQPTPITPESLAEPYLCPYCSRTFKGLPSLKLHSLETHSREELHVCQTCNAPLRGSYALKRHTRAHSGEPP